MPEITKNPRSSVAPATAFLGCAGLGLGLWLTHALELGPSTGLALLLLLTAVPMWIAEFRYNNQGSLRSLWHIPSKCEIKSKLQNIFAACLIWLSILCGMRIFAAEYISGFFDVLIYWAFILPVFLASYFFSFEISVGRRSIGELFRFISRRDGSIVPWLAIRTHVIKAFFLPLMTHAAYTWLIRAGAPTPRGVEPVWFVAWFAILYLLDTIFATLGYITTSKAIGANVRSTDTTWLGWSSALICYAPFHKVVAAWGLTAYQSKYQWYDWVPHGGVAFYVWAFLILGLSTIYAWATVVFGLRFSNLTNRGVITNGPFRFTKHPAYISKNLSWWLISVPFFSVLGVGQALMHCAALLFVNMIYYVRAKTEERHMMSDQTYRDYSNWINEYGAIARCSRALGLLLPQSRNPKRL